MFTPFSLKLFNFLRLGEKRERRHCDTSALFGNRLGIHPHRSLYSESDFQHLLYLERRRSERSSRPFCLILLAGAKIDGDVVREHAFRQMFQALRSSVRETDILGWYEQDRTLALLFPDLNTIAGTVIEGLRKKVSDVVATALTPPVAIGIGISVHVHPESQDLEGGMRNRNFYPDVPPQYEIRRAAHLLKRLTDVVGSLVLLATLAPIFAVIAVSIKLSSKGPVIFRQVRIGQQGRPFSFLKFRSMYMGSDSTIHKEYVTKFISSDQPASGSDAVYKITDDPRITPVGRVLRKASLDELPQLWNVFRGEMSLVGPRPALPYEVECYAAWHRRRVLEVKPGITGLWQVTGRSRTTFNEMVRLDLKYVRQWSIWLDFKILLQTPKAVLMGEGAY